MIRCSPFSFHEYGATIIPTTMWQMQKNQHFIDFSRGLELAHTNQPRVEMARYTPRDALGQTTKSCSGRCRVIRACTRTEDTRVGTLHSYKPVCLIKMVSLYNNRTRQMPHFCASQSTISAAFPTSYHHCGMKTPARLRCLVNKQTHTHTHMYIVVRVCVCVCVLVGAQYITTTCTCPTWRIEHYVCVCVCVCPKWVDYNCSFLCMHTHTHMSSAYNHLSFEVLSLFDCSRYTNKGGLNANAGWIVLFALTIPCYTLVVFFAVVVLESKKWGGQIWQIIQPMG